MKKKIAVMMLLLSLLEFGVGAYFLFGYFNARRLSMTGLGPAWFSLTSYWSIIAIRSLSAGAMTLFTSYLLFREKRLGIWLAFLSIGLFILVLTAIKTLLM